MVDTLFLRISTALVFLVYASYLDIKTREIDSRLWRSMVALGVLYLFMDFYVSKSVGLLISAVIVLSLAVIFALSIHYFGLMGGGDAKLLIALGAVFPILPSGSFIMPAFFLSVFTNAIFIAFFVPLAFFAHNLKHLRDVKSLRDILRLFIAYKKDASDIGDFETILKEGQLIVNPNEVELGKTEQEGEVWATPALPFVVFLTIGFVISVLYGDLLSVIF